MAPAQQRQDPASRPSGRLAWRRLGRMRHLGGRSGTRSNGDWRARRTPLRPPPRGLPPQCGVGVGGRVALAVAVGLAVAVAFAVGLMLGGSCACCGYWSCWTDRCLGTSAMREGRGQSGIGLRATSGCTAGPPRWSGSGGAAIGTAMSAARRRGAGGGCGGERGNTAAADRAAPAAPRHPDHTLTRPLYGGLAATGRPAPAP
jgi:hypothetical protein